MFKKIKNQLNSALPLLFEMKTVSDIQQALFEYFKKNNKSDKKQVAKTVAIQCVEDDYYFSIFGQIALSLNISQPITVDQIVFRSLNANESNSLVSFVWKRFIESPTLRKKWITLYNSFCRQVGFNSTGIQPLNDMVDLYHSWKVWRNLTTKQSIIDLALHNIYVGDLIYDSYLRFKPSETVDIHNRYLWLIIWQAYRDIRRSQKYFSSVKPKLFLTSYTTYIQHGIPVRVALNNDVRVFSFGNYQQFAKELSNTDWSQTKNTDKYSKAYSVMENKDGKLALADNAMTLRMSGQLDNATAYMKESAYRESNQVVPNVVQAIVIFLHDFYDSPHVYRSMLFPDFWEWICFTIDTLKNADIKFFIKPHPNQIKLSDKALDKLKNLYPEANFISPKITNKQLVVAGMSCAVTVYGTVAHEMAYLGVPTIACGDNPHMSFNNICKLANSIEDYERLLLSFENFVVNKQNLRKESLAFYYMHNMYISDAERLLVEKVCNNFRHKCDVTDNSDELVVDLYGISQLEAFQSYVFDWNNIIQGL